MDIKDIDIELNLKTKEVFKKTLKENNVEIVFENPNEELNIIESIVVKTDKHLFVIRFEQTYKWVEMMNEKYLPFLTKKMKNIKSDNKIDLIKNKFWYSFLFKPFLGKLTNFEKIYKQNYLMSYNSVIINLTEIEYKRLAYYSRYVYKLMQLYTLNTELGITQKFNIVFDDDKMAKQMYNDFYESFKGLIEPFDKKS